MDSAKAQFSITCYFQRKEFVGQKPLSQDEEEIITGETVSAILDSIWDRAVPFIKREVLVKDDQFEWCDNAMSMKDEMGKFITFQDRNARKCYLVDQFNSTLLSRLRNNPVNVMIHIYGRQLCNKSIHRQFTLKLLQPEQRDRANADNTQSLMAMVKVLKEKHGHIFSAGVGVWQMWANAIHSAAPHLQDEMVNNVPPVHLIHLFVRASTSEAEVRESVQRGLKVADDMNDTYCGFMAMLRKDFDKIRDDTNRGFDFMDARLKAFEDVLNSNRRLVIAMGSSVTPQPSAVNVEEERQITDLDDLDHSD